MEAVIAAEGRAASGATPTDVRRGHEALQPHEHAKGRRDIKPPRPGGIWHVRFPGRQGPVHEVAVPFCPQLVPNYPYSALPLFWSPTSSCDPVHKVPGIIQVPPSQPRKPITLFKGSWPASAR